LTSSKDKLRDIEPAASAAFKGDARVVGPARKKSGRNNSYWSRRFEVTFAAEAQGKSPFRRGVVDERIEPIRLCNNNQKVQLLQIKGATKCSTSDINQKWSDAKVCLKATYYELCYLPA
jgi:hypothetical protein